jgi:hypothetical protein
MKEINVKQINTQISLREVCASYTFPRVELPIKGGWGYTKKEAIIIDKNDPVVPKELPFDGIGLEYDILEKRIDLEFTLLQDKKDMYKNVHWERIKHEMIQDQDRIYDKITVKITALSFEDWKSRRIEWKENGHKPDFDKEWFLAKTLELTQYCYRDFWFDITSFYGT